MKKGQILALLGPFLHSPWSSWKNFTKTKKALESRIATLLSAPILSKLCCLLLGEQFGAKKHRKEPYIGFAWAIFTTTSELVEKLHQKYKRP
jgi:hypothetical protein